MAIEHAAATLPPALIEAATRLFDGEQEVYFAGIRHHSPACALNLRAMLHEIKPTAVLVEGPDDLDHLLPLLQHEDTRPPVALLCQSNHDRPALPGSEAGDGGRAETRSAFIPFCDYSPEWIALRESNALGAQVAFIDLSWQDKAWRERRAEDGNDAARSLMEERHFAHSRYLGTMAQRLGCVDHHELWDRLFELRAPAAQPNWRAFFADVFHWCAMARLDYEHEVLETEGSLPRERHMAAHIRRWRARCSGPIVVVTGGFHTLELVQQWQRTEPLSAPANAKNNAAAWLIRYSFDRLDALNGYASGMPSPGYYQQVWEQLSGGSVPGTSGESPYATVAVECLTRFARHTRAEDYADSVSTALVQAAVAQAARLAALRGNAGPGRQDLLDAIRSCFIKGPIDEGQRGFTADLRRFLSGSQVGDIPPSAGSPPLVEDARRLARKVGLRLDDSTPRVSRLDLYRKPLHQVRSRYFHAMAYLGAPLATWLTGPDFLGNSRLQLMFEEWQVAWSPLVEARLIELASTGVTVEAACMSRLRRDEDALAEQGSARSASAAVMLLLRACLIGLQARLPQLLVMLATHLEEDSNLGSVIECGHRLVTLWRAREPLGVQQHPALRALLEQVWPAALFLLPNLSQVDEADEARAVTQLTSLRELGRLLAALDPHERIDTDDARLHAQLERFATAVDTPPAVCGAAAAFLFLDGRWDELALGSLLGRHFGVGADAGQAVRFLNGLTTAAPELLLRVPVLLEGLDRLVHLWGADAFIAHLPDLRQAFTRLKPQETAALASRIARLHGLDDGAASLVQMHDDTSEEDLRTGLKLQSALTECLRRDGLAGWLGQF
ncbi:hypothetical protein C0Z18_00550 [Trinickia dabaoshanensis]|uniref:4-aminobutyrate aminotransferase n=1 Tax=Trinickia dabaoshanensis TaxID=564714 RepID=A0A2N7W2T9_9BURK|nr:DUF5682 family protein [Trinickia dabaoshanensis]PMS23706.1 hypothetical protein C0Z18_00550 [Trinickia dabaoshanensis]